MTGKEFIKEFEKQMNKKKDILKGKYSPDKLKEYTTEINGIIKEIIDDDSNEGKHYSEYFRIDHSSWIVNEVKSRNNCNVKIYDWDFNLAIEHENNSRDWTYEMLKLSFVKAKAKIVIGYFDNKYRKDGYQNEKDVIAEQANYINQIDEGSEFYVVLLNKYYSDDNPFDIQVHDVFEIIENNHIG